MALREVRPVWFVGVVLYSIALIAYIVGFATKEWFTINEIQQAGLFRVCNLRTGACVDIVDDPGETNWRVGQGLTSTGLAFLLIGGTLTFASVIFDTLTLMSLAGCFPIIMGGGLGAAGGIYHLVKGSDLISGAAFGEFSVDWSSLVFIVAAFVEIISGIILLVAFSIRNRGSQQRGY